MFRTDNVREVLIKSGMQIAQAGFSFDCMKTTQEYLMYFKEFSGNQAEKCKQDACRDLFSASLGKGEKRFSPAAKMRSGRIFTFGAKWAKFFQKTLDME